MKYFVIVKGFSGSAQFTVEPCSAKMTVRDVRDMLKTIIEDTAMMEAADGMQPVIVVSQATRKRSGG